MTQQEFEALVHKTVAAINSDSFFASKFKDGAAERIIENFHPANLPYAESTKRALESLICDELDGILTSPPTIRVLEKA